MIITSSGGVFHILFTDYTNSSSHSRSSGIIISQPVTRPIIKCTYLSVMCQLMPPGARLLPFPVNTTIFFFFSLSLPLHLCRRVGIIVGISQEIRIIICNLQCNIYIMQYYDYYGLARCKNNVAVIYCYCEFRWFTFNGLCSSASLSLSLSTCFSHFFLLFVFFADIIRTLVEHTFFFAHPMLHDTSCSITDHPF